MNAPRDPIAGYRRVREKTSPAKPGAVARQGMPGTRDVMAPSETMKGLAGEELPGCQSALNPDPLSACKNAPPYSMEVVPVVHGRAPRGFV